MENIDFIYENQERGITILVRTYNNNGKFRSAIKICSIAYNFDWLFNKEPYKNQIESIIFTLNNLYHDICEKDIVYYKELLQTLSDALNEAKKLRFQQLDLFDNGCSRKTYRISTNVPQSSRRKDKSQLSIYD